MEPRWRGRIQETSTPSSLSRVVCLSHLSYSLQDHPASSRNSTSSKACGAYFRSRKYPRWARIQATGTGLLPFSASKDRRKGGDLNP